MQCTGGMYGVRTRLGIAPSASVWYGYGQLELEHDGSPELAVELFREGTQRAVEDTAFVWHSWGMLELSRKRVNNARCIFADALRRYPRCSRLLVGAAWAASAAVPSDSKLEREARLFFSDVLLPVTQPMHMPGNHGLCSSSSTGGSMLLEHCSNVD